MTEQTRDFLAAVLEALDAPEPASSSDHLAYLRLLERRAIGVRVALRRVITDNDPPLAWSAAWLRDQSAAMQPNYRTTSDHR